MFRMHSIGIGAVIAVMTTQLAMGRTNRITIKGSTTVLPIAQSVAEVFMGKNPAVNISVQGGGSGVGVAGLIDKTCDIANSSRSIKDQEISKAVERGVQPYANVVAMDGIAIIVNPGNPLDKITKSQLLAIYTGRISDWSELGGSAGKIVVVSRDTASGTFEAFNELALGKARVRPDALMQASNQAVASVVARTPGAIGYVGLGYLTPSVKTLTYDGVNPSHKTVLTGEYKLSRPLFMYTQGEPKGHVKEFMDFLMSEEGQMLVEKAGFIGLK